MQGSVWIEVADIHINNEFTDQRADLWSYGVFLTMLLTGTPPFKGGSDYLTFKRALALK